MRVFLDANILFSASNPGWLTARFLDLLNRHAELVTSEFALAEAESNLKVFEARFLPHLHAWMPRIKVVPEFEFRADTLALPAKDWPIFSSAIHSQCTHLLTGDKKHFRHLMEGTAHGVHIMDQKMLMEALLAAGLVGGDIKT